MKNNTLVSAVKRWDQIVEMLLSHQIEHFEACALNNLWTGFLKEELNISMFIPAKLVDGNWVVLEEPEHYESFLKVRHTNEAINIECEEYQTALDNVIFEIGPVKHTENITWILSKYGLYYHHVMNKFTNHSTKKFETIEDLCELGLTLTPAAVNKYMR